MCFTDAGLSEIKKWQESKLENGWFVTNYSKDIHEHLQVNNLNAAKKRVFKPRKPNLHDEME